MRVLRNLVLKRKARLWSLPLKNEEPKKTDCLFVGSYIERRDEDGCSTLTSAEFNFLSPFTCRYWFRFLVSVHHRLCRSPGPCARNDICDIAAKLTRRVECTRKLLRLSESSR